MFLRHSVVKRLWAARLPEPVTYSATVSAVAACDAI